MLTTTGSPTRDLDRVLGEFDSIDEMEQELARLEASVSADRGRQVEILAGLDHLQVPYWDGTRSLKEWIAGRLDISPRNASDLAILAKSDIDYLHDELRVGVITTDRAAATARLINTGATEDIIERASGVAVGQIGQLAARHQRMTPASETMAFGMRRLWYQPNLANTVATGTFTLAGSDAEAMMQALDERADQLVDPHDPLLPSLEQRRADALVSLALDQTVPASGDRAAPRRLKSTIFIDATQAQETNGEAGAITRSGLKVGPKTLAEILCVGETETTLIDIDGLKSVPTDGDRIPARTRDYIFFRDGSCTADGCTSRYRLEPHHKTHRQHGGDDDPEGLTLLCWFHHHVVIHQYGFTIDPDSPPGRLRFLAPGVTRAPPDG